MAGWTRYNEESGELETELYERPFVVRATPRKLGIWDRPEDVTITAFRTEAEAIKWLEQNAPEYQKGPFGFASLHVENWNL